MSDVILIQISGQDKPGITASIMDMLSVYEVNVLDIGQEVIHDSLSIGILIEVPDEAESSPILKDILFCAHGLGVSVRFTPISHEDYQVWVGAQGRPRYIVTLLAKKITADHISKVTRIIVENDLNIDTITRLSGRIPLMESNAQSKSCVEFLLRGEAKDLDKMRSEFLTVTSFLGVDIAFQEDNIYRRNRRMVVFDMDSTLIEQEVIDLLAEEAGVGEEVAAITEMAMQGEIDFNVSFKKRVALLKGLDESVLAKVAARLKLTDGAEVLISTLRQLGYKTAIISGGFEYFGHYLQNKLDIDYVYANKLLTEDGAVTGQVEEPIINGEMKATLMKKICSKENIILEQVVAVGDGANDLPMLTIAGLGIAFKAKPLVKKSARQSISTLGLDSVLYLIGMRDREALKK